MSNVTGFAIVEGVLCGATVDHLLTFLERIGDTASVRKRGERYAVVSQPKLWREEQPEEGMRRAMVNEVFDPSALEQMCRRDLPAALRLLAEHLERGEISATLWGLQGNGMVQDWRREHFIMTLDLAVAPVRTDRDSVDKPEL